MRFEKTEEGIIDNQTGLIWKAEDEPGWFTFDKAVEHAKNTDWRVPTIDELNSIVDRTKFNPASNPIFNMKSSVYWSCSPNANYSGNAWYVSFNDGYVNDFNRNNDLHVRLVRSMEKKNEI